LYCWTWTYTLHMKFNSSKTFSGQSIRSRNPRNASKQKEIYQK
jgi:hypothetical protein